MNLATSSRTGGHLAPSGIIRLFATLTFAVLAVVALPTQAADTASPSQKPIWVAVDVIAPPFVFKQNDKIVGFDVDMIRAISKAADLDLKFKIMPWRGIIPSLQSGAVDAAVDAITIKADRLARVNFTNAYYKSGLSVLVHDDSPIKSYADLAGKIVGAKKASAGADYVLNHDPGIKAVKQYDTAADMYQALESRGVDAVVNDNPMNLVFASKRPDVHVVGKLLQGAYYGIAVTKHRPDLVAKLNTGLAKIKQNGAYDALFQKWFGGDKSGAVPGVVKPDNVFVTN